MEMDVRTVNTMARNVQIGSRGFPRVYGAAVLSHSGI